MPDRKKRNQIGTSEGATRMDNLSFLLNWILELGWGQMSTKISNSIFMEQHTFDCFKKCHWKMHLQSFKIHQLE